MVSARVRARWEKRRHRTSGTGRFFVIWKMEGNVKSWFAAMEGEGSVVNAFSLEYFAAFSSQIKK